MAMALTSQTGLTISNELGGGLGAGGVRLPGLGLRVGVGRGIGFAVSTLAFAPVAGIKLGTG
jgi:hypothetical protein